MKLPTKFGDYVYQYTYEYGSYGFGVQSWVCSVLKNGKEGKSTRYVSPPYTALRICTKCGKLGRTNQIQQWGLYEGFASTQYLLKKIGVHENHGIMCLSCANRLRPAIRARNEFIDTNYVLTNASNKIKRLIKENKNGN